MSAADCDSGTQEIDAEQLCAYGILLMIGWKVTVAWLGLDPDSWYVWPWSWVAFGLMCPAIVEWVNESRGE